MDKRAAPQLQMEIRHHEDCDFILQEVQRLFATAALASPDKTNNEAHRENQQEEEPHSTP
jgi:hypothetical protein